MSGVTARPISRAMTRPVQALSLLEGVGRIEQITGASVTLSHEAIPAAEWPAMTMTFTLPDRAVASGHAVGERVRFAFDRPGGVPTVRRIVTDGASQ